MHVLALHARIHASGETPQELRHEDKLKHERMMLAVLSVTWTSEVEHGKWIGWVGLLGAG